MIERDKNKTGHIGRRIKPDGCLSELCQPALFNAAHTYRVPCCLLLYNLGITQ